jgi:membrane protein
MPKPIQYLVWSFQDYSKDNGPQWAAALSYYTLMSIFPLMLAALSIAAMFVSPDWAVSQALKVTGDFLPSGQDQIRSTVEGVFAARGPASIVSILLLLWSGTQIFGVATQALNIAFDADEKLSFIKRALIQLATAVTLGLLLLAALVSSAVIGVAWRFIDPFDLMATIRSLLQFGVQGMLLLLVFFFAYRFLPRTKVHSRSAWTGAIFAAVLFLIVRPAFSYYIGRFSNYNLVYGALAGVIILVLWAYISASIFLIGGQMAALVEGLKYQGKTREDVVKSHDLRSPVRKVKQALEERAPAKSGA